MEQDAPGTTERRGDVNELPSTPQGDGDSRETHETTEPRPETEPRDGTAPEAR